MEVRIYYQGLRIGLSRGMNESPGLLFLKKSLTCGTAALGCDTKASLNPLNKFFTQEALRADEQDPNDHHKGQSILKGHGNVASG